MHSLKLIFFLGINFSLISSREASSETFHTHSEQGPSQVGSAPHWPAFTASGWWFVQCLRKRQKGRFCKVRASAVSGALSAKHLKLSWYFLHVCPQKDPSHQTFKKPITQKEISESNAELHAFCVFFFSYYWHSACPREQFSEGHLCLPVIEFWVTDGIPQSCRKGFSTFQNWPSVNC